MNFLQNQLQTARQEIDQLKTRQETLRQTSNVENNEKSSTTNISDSNSTVTTGIKDSNRDDFVAWSVSERQQGEVMFCFFVVSPLKNFRRRNFKKNKKRIFLKFSGLRIG